MDRYEELVASLRAEIPGFRIIYKHESRFHRGLDVALRVATLGRMRGYLDSYQTTIGSTVYVTRDWDSWDADRRYVTLRHEAVHLRQFRTWTLPMMIILYLIVPLPMGLAYFRARFEKAAYAETIRASAEVWGSAYAGAASLRRHVIDQFLGPNYGWMWPFRRHLERWYDRVLRTVVAA